MTDVDFVVWEAEAQGWRFDPSIESVLAELVAANQRLFAIPLDPASDVDLGRMALLQIVLPREVFAAYMCWLLRVVERWTAHLPS